MIKTPSEIPFDKVIQALLDESQPFHPRYLYRLSDLSPTDLASLSASWRNVSQRRRQAVMEDVQEMNESDYLMNFSTLSRLALTDPDPLVRVLAIQTLREYEEPDLASVFLEMMAGDPDVQVRAASAAALGTFTYLGEIEELPERLFHEVEESLLKVTRSQDATLVRRRALEALGFSSREEVSPLIEAAYESDDHDWILTALFAMGRSYNTIWANKVMAKLDDESPEIRAEAAGAAGELNLNKSTPKLIELLGDEDEDVRAAAIWALSEIGGEGAREALEEMLEETEDDEEADLLEDALENLGFMEGLGDLSLLDLPEEGEEVDEEDIFEEDFEENSDE